MGKKKTQKFHRTTLTIPMALKQRMDKAGSEVNWSSAATKAFEAIVADIEERQRRQLEGKENKQMENVLQRLRQSKERAENTSFAAGEQAGRWWVNERAEFEQLEHLEKLENSCRPTEWNQLFDENENDAYAVAERIFFVLEPRRDRDRDAAEDFWRFVSKTDDDELPNETFVKGFVNEVLNVWSEIKGQL